LIDWRVKRELDRGRGHSGCVHNEGVFILRTSKRRPPLSPPSFESVSVYVIRVGAGFAARVVLGYGFSCACVWLFEDFD